MGRLGPLGAAAAPVCLEGTFELVSKQAERLIFDDTRGAHMHSPERTMTLYHAQASIPALHHS